MQVVIVFVALFAVALAAPQHQADKDAVIVRLESDNIGVDGYHYSAETSNGIAIEEEGKLENAGSEDESIAVRGSFKWTAPDGQQYTVTYIADKNGFQPQGAHIPQAPPL